MEATTLESIVKSATTTLILFDDDEEEFLPSENQPNANPTPQTIDPIPEITNPPTPSVFNPAPEDPTPRCSNRIAEKPAIQGPSHLERVIQESADAASRLKTACTERKKTLQDL